MTWQRRTEDAAMWVFVASLIATGVGMVALVWGLALRAWP